MATSSFVLAAALLAVLLAVQVSGDDPVCSLPLDKGTCGGQLIRWYYNATRAVCIPFSYGGCKGNANTFKDRFECEKSCGAPVNPRPKTACSLKPNKGPCTGKVKRFVYIDKIKRCIAFPYGGCKGNANNFRTSQECAKFCGPPPKPRPLTACSMPMLKGPCTGNIQRYYYNAALKSCLPFAYGGCKGNANNFGTLKGCKWFCGIPPFLRPRSACSLPADKGPCKGQVKRYYYSPAQKMCLSFSYGGCMGNDNNFDSILECTRFCTPRP